MKHYDTLSPHERFVLMIEAMARKDEVECDRLEDSCPRLTYRAEDAEFRDRMRRVYHIAMTVALNMRAGLARVRMAEAFRETAPYFAAAVERFAKAAFLCGRAHGRAGAGLTSAGPYDPPALAEELVSDPQLQQELAEIRDVAAEVVREVAGTLHHAVGEADTAELLSQWEGFTRFCRDALHVEPLVLLRALGLGHSDPAAEVRAAYPDAAVDEAEIARWSEQWTRGWERRFAVRR
jgi:hypothetical protein